MRAWLFAFLTFTISLGQAQTINHVVVVALENHGYDQVVGNGNMPYFNDLANTYGLATNYYANHHSSIGDYFRLTTGETITNESWFDARVSVDNMVRRLNAAGKTWKNYAESIPSAGYLGGSSGAYAKHHDPFAYFTDVIDDSSQAARIVPYSQLSADLASGSLPNFSFIQVNQLHNGHDCPNGGSVCSDTDKLIATDQWLSANLPQILNDPVFKQDGLLIVWYDEASGSDSTNGGGHVAVIFAGNYAKPGFRSATFYRHENLARTVMELLGVANFPGSAYYAASMGEFLQSAPPPASGTLTGKVTNISNGYLISNATVSYSGGSALTNVTGAYSISGLTDGSYSVTVNAVGYINRAMTASVVNQVGVLNVPLATGGKIKGTVTNSAGIVITGAKVTITGGVVPANVSATSTSTGYSSNWIPIGSYTVAISAPGYTAQSMAVTVNTGATSTLNFVL